MVMDKEQVAGPGQVFDCGRVQGGEGKQEVGHQPEAQLLPAVEGSLRDTKVRTREFSTSSPSG